jgi:hypothetical protein
MELPAAWGAMCPQFNENQQDNSRSVENMAKMRPRATTDCNVEQNSGAEGIVE